MAKEFTIPELVVMAADLNYKPSLATAINKLIRARDKDSYKIAQQEATEAIVGYQIDSVESLRDYGSTDTTRLSGLPVFQPLTLSTDDLSLQLDSVVVTVNRTKNIVTTVVQGRNSSIKEFINNGDFSISVTGIVSNNTWSYPTDKVVKLHQVLEQNQNIEVTHEILNALGIYEIVITDYSLDQTPYINCQSFTFNALSDNPLPLIAQDVPTILLT